MQLSTIWNPRFASEDPYSTTPSPNFAEHLMWMDAVQANTFKIAADNAEKTLPIALNGC
jgi:hypothetical protein